MSSLNVHIGRISVAFGLLAVVTGCAPPTETEKRADGGLGGPPKALQLMDLAGAIVDPLQQSTARVTVFIFTRVDCPVSNRYAPEIKRIFQEFRPRGVAFYLVYPDPDQATEGIIQHMKEYDYPFRALRDTKHDLVARSGATVTPEAAVFLQNGELAYCGRIDDWYADFGKARAAPTQRDLRTALRAVLAGRAAPSPTGKAVGCYISDLSPSSGSHGKQQTP